MAVQEHIEGNVEPDVGGFAVLDAKGRLTLPAALRDALGLRTGSTVACLPVRGGIMLIPQDRELAEFLEQAPRALEKAGLTVQDLLDNLPKAREEVMIELYGNDYVRSLEQRFAGILGSELRQPHDE